MRSHKKELEVIANDYLIQSGKKPNFSNRDFMNAAIIFQTALMDKMYDNQDYDDMDVEDRLKMSNQCGLELHKLIRTYTGLNTHKVEDFL